MTGIDTDGPIPFGGQTELEARVRREIVAIRRAIHHHPELSWDEHRTAERVEAYLTANGIEHRRVAGTGVVGNIPGRRRGPIIAIRADLDALPIQEETGLDFASDRIGVMHACGHDAHTSMVLGAGAMIGAGETPEYPVRLIFQPAEEVAQGAKAMIDAGVLEGVGMIFGGHVDRHYDAGTIVVSEGPVNAYTDLFRIEVTGQGAHAARPHESVDAVVVGSLLVMSLQTIVSREIDPAHPSVVTIGLFDAGTAANVIADKAVLLGTIRAQDMDVREHLCASIKRMTTAIGELHDTRVSFEITDGTNAVINTPEMAAIARSAALRVVGPGGLAVLKTANMGAEDFGEYLLHVPGCYVRFGAILPGFESFPAHSSRFAVNEDALWIGARYFAEVVRAARESLAG